MRFGTDRTETDRSGSERSGAGRPGVFEWYGAGRSGAERAGPVRTGGKRHGPDRFGPDRSGGPVLDGATFGAVWRTVAVANRGLRRREAPACPAGRSTPAVPDGSAQQQGEEEEGEHLLFVPEESDEQGKGAMGEEMVGERVRDRGKGRPSGQPRTQKSGMW